MSESEYVVKRENSHNESVLYAHITWIQMSSLFCLCSVLIVIKSMVLHISVLCVNTEEPVDEPIVRETYKKRKGKIKVTARETLSDSSIQSDNGQAD